MNVIRVHILVKIWFDRIRVDNRGDTVVAHKHKQAVSILIGDDEDWCYPRDHHVSGEVGILHQKIY